MEETTESPAMEMMKTSELLAERVSCDEKFAGFTGRKAIPSFRLS